MAWMSLRARHRTVAHTGAVLGGKVSKAAPAPALGAGEQMQIELVPAWPPAHCSAIKTDRLVLHVRAGRTGAPACPSVKIAKTRGDVTVALGDVTFIGLMF